MQSCFTVIQVKNNKQKNKGHPHGWSRHNQLISDFFNQTFMQEDRAQNTCYAVFWRSTEFFGWLTVLGFTICVQNEKLQPDEDEMV